MRPIELRHALTRLFLQAGGPLRPAELSAEVGVPVAEVVAALAELQATGLVVADALPGAPLAEVGFHWAARWRATTAPQVASSAAGLAERTTALRERFGEHYDILDPPAVTFQRFLVDEYRPPVGQRWLVLLQCSVRRPFSSSPSHASLRRAIAAATGFDPAVDRDKGLVHVVVLASRMGPVPYDLEDVYPANVRSGGVRGFDEATYARYRPVLAARLAEYLTAHREHYVHVAAFGEGRYAEAMRDAILQSGIDFPVLPHPGGPQLTRRGRSRPRKYWERYWIQLYVALAEWLDPAARRRAAQRLQALDVEYT